MTKEEKIKLLNEAISNTEEDIAYRESTKNNQGMNTEGIEEDIENSKYLIEMLKRELAFQQIPLRTIETLQVEDVFVMDYKDYKGNVVDENIKISITKIEKVDVSNTVDDVKIDYWITLSNGQSRFLSDIKYKQIIPHEFLELWGERE